MTGTLDPISSERITTQTSDLESSPPVDNSAHSDSIPETATTITTPSTSDPVDTGNTTSIDSITPIPSERPALNPQIKSMIDYCTTKFEDVIYILDPCSIDTTISLSEGDKSFEYKIVPTDSDASYSFSVYGYGE